MPRTVFLISSALFVLFSVAACNNAAPTQNASNVDRDKLARFVTRFLDVTIGSNEQGTNYILVGEAPQSVSSRLPKDSEIIGSVVDTASSQTQSLVDIPVPATDVIAHFRDALTKDGWRERGLDGGAPNTSPTGPFVFCAQDTSLIAVAYDPNAPRQGYTSTLLTTVTAGAAGSPCAAPIAPTAVTGVQETPSPAETPAATGSPEPPLPTPSSDTPIPTASASPTVAP